MADRVKFANTPVNSAGTTEILPGITISDGAARNAAAFADGLNKVSTRVSDMSDTLERERQRQLDRDAAAADDELDREAIQAGGVEGMRAGRDTETFELTDGVTLRDAAFNRAGLNVFLSSIEVQARTEIDALFEQHGSDPLALQEHLDGYKAGVLTQLNDDLPQAVAPFDEMFTRATLPLVRTAKERHRTLLEQEAEAKLLETIEVHGNSAARSAFLTVDPAEAALTAAIERDRFIDRLVEHGPRQGFKFHGREVAPNDTRNHVLTPAQMERELQRFDKLIYEQTVLGTFSRSGDKSAFLERFSTKERENKSSPLDLDDVGRLEASMRSEITRERVVANAARAALRTQVTDAVFVLDRGRTPPGLPALRRAVSQFPDLAAQLDGATQDRAMAENFLTMTPIEQQNTLNTLAGDKDATRRQQELIDRLDRLHSHTVESLNSDPVSFVAETGLAPVDPVNFSDPQSLVGRRIVVDVLNEHYGIQSHGFTADEVNTFEASLASMETTGRVELMAVLNNGIEPDRLRLLMGEIADKQPTFAIAALLTSEDTATAMEIVRGQTVLETVKGVRPSTADYLPVARELLGDVFAHDDRAFGDVVEAAIAVEAFRRFGDNGDTTLAFDEDRFERAITDIVGGVVEWRGQTLLAPVRGMTEDEFDELMDELTMNDVLASVPVASAAGRQPVLPPELLPRTQKGAVSVDDIRTYGRLEQADDGLYFVWMANGYLVQPNGERYVLDLKQAAQRRRGR